MDCMPEVKEKLNFMSLFGLDPDPALYSRMTETESLPAKNLRNFLKATDHQEEQILPMLGIVTRTMERHLEAERFHPDEADRLFRVARAFDGMIKTLGDPGVGIPLEWFCENGGCLDSRVKHPRFVNAQV
jgi:hypothetical protein